MEVVVVQKVLSEHGHPGGRIRTLYNFFSTTSVEEDGPCCHALTNKDSYSEDDR